MNGHIGRSMADCPACLGQPGWQNTHGLRYAVQNIRHEATTEEELDLAEACLWVAEHHRPDDNLVCVECGEPWWIDPNVGLVQCRPYLDARIHKNTWVIQQITKIRDRWRSHT